MTIKVTRAQAIDALLTGKWVYSGDEAHAPHGFQLGVPELYSRRRASRVLTKFFYSDALYPRYAKICYWVIE